MNDGETRTEWKQLLDEVMAETDKAKLEQKAIELETALFMRGQELALDGAAEVERKSLQDAIQKLLRVRVERLGFPMDEKLLGRTGGARKAQ
jgi:uncharacterized circularly permuted ATP-grasp superfamily protein